MYETCSEISAQNWETRGMRALRALCLRKARMPWAWADICVEVVWKERACVAHCHHLPAHSMQRTALLHRMCGQMVAVLVYGEWTESNRRGARELRVDEQIDALLLDVKINRAGPYTRQIA